MLHYRSLHSESELVYRPQTSSNGISFCGVHLLDKTSKDACTLLCTCTMYLVLLTNISTLLYLLREQVKDDSQDRRNVT